MFQKEKTVKSDVAALLRASAVVCRIVSARYTRLALWATSLDKTIFNRFICTNPVEGFKKRTVLTAFFVRFYCIFTAFMIQYT